MKVRFGDLTFDGGRRMLLRGSQPVPMSPKAFQLLELLLEKRPDAVSKTDIQDVLWPGTFVSESSLHVLVNEVRRALRQRSRGPGFVRTVRGFGYAFDGEARALAPSATSTRRHVLLRGAQEFELSEGENVLGREPTVSIRIDDPSISREHARITVAGRRATLEDLGSKNGTFRAGTRVKVPVELVDGDEVLVGQVVLRYETGSFEPSTRTVL